jgi:hypothetical protein
MPPRELVVLVRVLRNGALAAGAALAAWAVVFLTIELFPGWLNRMPLDGITYYSLKRRYVSDPDLVFAYRHTATIRRERSQYVGDLYSPRYGVPAEPFEYVATYDERGFRRGTSKPPFEIVVIGDSFIEIGESDAVTFSELLHKASGRSVLDLGRAWYGPQQYLALFERYAVPERPAVALLCFFAGNDFDDIHHYEEWRGGSKFYFYEEIDKAPIGARFLRATAESIGFLVARLGLRRADTGPRGLGPSSLGLIDLGDRTQLMAFAYWERKISSDELDRLREILAVFKATAEDAGIAPWIVYIPTATQIYAQRHSADSHPSFIERVRTMTGHPSREAVVHLSAELGIELVDLLPAFETLAEEGRLLYYPFDTHWNAEGRRAAAEVIATHLARR